MLLFCRLNAITKVLQAHVDGALLGQSPTQQFAYSVMLWRTPIILTTNKWELDALCPADLDWIEANAVAVPVDDPVWLCAPIPEPDALPLPGMVVPIDVDVPLPRMVAPATPRARRRSAYEAMVIGASPEHTRARYSA